MAPVHAWLRLTRTWLRTLQTSPDLCRHHRLRWHGLLVPLPLSPVLGSTLLLRGEALSVSARPPPKSHSQQMWLPSGPAPMTRVRRPGWPYRHPKSPGEPSQALFTATGAFCPSESPPPLKDMFSVSG